MKILVVEDDENVAQTLKFLLSSYTYAVDMAADGEAGLQMADAFDYDLIVLDLVLPGLDGIGVCQQLRAKGLQLPILLLTGRDGGHQKAVALNAGADDYVVKPFDSEEFIARVQSLLRRSSSIAQPVLQWGNLCIKPSDRKVTYGTQLLALTPKEYAILELLLRNHQKVLSARAIVGHVWDSMDCPGEEAVRVHIKALRQKLKAAGAPADFVKTVYRTGYQLNPLYSSVLAAQSDQQPTVLQIAELKSVNEELRTVLEELQTAQEELIQQNEKLKIARQTIEREQQRYRDLFEFAPDGYFVTDIYGNIQEANRAAVALLAVELRYLLGKPLSVFIAETDRPLFRTQLACLNFEQNWEITIQPRSGDAFPALISVTLIQHQTAELRWSLRDIRHRKQIEQQLQAAHNQLEVRVAERTAELVLVNARTQQREHQWQALFEHALDAIVIADNEGRYVDVNLAACELFGVSREEFLRLSVADFTDRDLFNAQWQQFLVQGQMSGEFCLHRRDGTLRQTEFAAIANFIPGRHLSILRDISSRKQAEIELREVSAALSNAIEGISRLDRQGRYVFVNEAYARITGYSPEEMIGMDWQSTVEPADRDSVMAAYEHMLSTGKAELEARGRRKDNSLFHKHLFLVATYREQQFTGHFCFMRDVSDRAQLKAERQQVAAALQQQLIREHLVAEMTLTIRQTLDLKQVLQRAVDQVQQVLQTDRALIFRFQPDWRGVIVAESAATGCNALLSMTIHDPCFSERYIEPYRRGRVSAIDDLDCADIEPCHAELLKSLQVKANLVVPILQREPSQTDPLAEDRLWGLLIAHHCVSPRPWQPEEIELLKQLANQLGIAIQQSELYQQTRRELLERRRMQEALQESEERFRSLSASAPVGIRHMNADGICLYSNPCWQDMSGLSQENSLGDGWTHAIHPDDREAIVAVWNAAILQQQRFSQEFKLLTPEHATRWVIAHVAPMRSESSELIGYVSMDRDITERKQAEQKIREQAALIDIATDAIFVQDLENHVQFWSQGAERLYGWTAAEALGKPASELFYREASAQPESAHLQTERNGTIAQGFWQGELNHFTKIGKAIIVASRWTLVRDELGQPESILVVNTDITAKKQLEAQFYRSQRLESLGTLASGIAHDLNNVLTPILGIAQLMRLKQQPLDERSQEMLKVLEDSAKRGSDLVKQILTFAQGTEGKQMSLHLGHLLLEVVKVVEQTFPQSIDIHIDLPHQPLWFVSADPTHLHQVFMNLCVNARDAMLNGGVLTLSVENCFIDATFAQLHLDAHEGNHLLVTIADTGTGIAPALLDRIFDPFFTTKEPGKGTGLGLSTVLGIVRNYRGFLQVNSQVGKGTQFQVYLPAIETASSAATPAEEPLHGNGELILIVDDDIAVQQINRSLLESYHYQTLIASDGIEAITLYAKHKESIRAVLIDIMMPNLDGVTAIRTLKKIDSSANVVAMSGLSHHEELALSAGANVFLPKPYIAADLLKNIYGLLTSKLASNQ